MLKNHLAPSLQRRAYTFFFLCLLWVSAGAGSAMAISLGTYSTTSVVAGQNVTITPSVAPTGVTSMVAYTNTNFIGVLSVNPTTGVVNVINAKQAGTYTVTVKAFDGAASASTTFTLNVTNPICSQGILGAATSFAPGAYLYGIATGDFNGDGRQDLAVAVNGSGRVSIHLGSGTGTFGAGTTFSAGMGTVSVAVGDFNGEGRQDIATANLSGNNVSILLGNGAGSFGAATNYSVGAQPFTDEVTVEVIDVRCGNSNANEKVLVCFGGKTLCVAPTAVPALLANGATLGACGITPCGTQSNARFGVESDEATRPMALMMQVYPNPTAGLVTVDLRNVSKGLARIEVVDLIGRPLVQKAEQMNEGANQLSFDLNQLPYGLYLIRCRDSQNHEAVVKVNKL